MRPPASTPPPITRPSPALATLRARVAQLERADATRPAQAPHPFGHPVLDAALPGGGLALGALHDITAADRADHAHSATAALFVAGILARLPGVVLWVLERPDLFAPGLAAVGLHPARILQAEVGTRRAVLPAVEEGLRQPGLAGVVGEVSHRVGLSASRRLQLAAGRSGTTAFLLRRGGADAFADPSCAVTRWRVGPVPTGPLVPDAPDVPGLARARWQVELVRCRGGEGGAWVMEACDAQGRLGVVPLPLDRQAAPPAWRAAG